jgi:alpha-tubulin suppressor-like RCC1 family protein
MESRSTTETNMKQLFILAWGPGNHGQLGLSSEDLLDHTLPQLMPNFYLRASLKEGEEKEGERREEKCRLKAGGGHVVAITSTSHTSSPNFTFTTPSVFVWGLNEKGQLGMGSINRICTATQLSFETEERKVFTKIACGWDFTLFLTEEGELWGTGNNSFSQLGASTTTTTASTPSWKDRRAAALKNKQPSSSAPSFSSSPLTSRASSDVLLPIRILLPLLNSIKLRSIHCGNRHSIAISEDGVAFSWGDGKFGQLGHNDFWSSAFSSFSSPSVSSSSSSSSSSSISFPRLISFFLKKRLTVLSAACGFKFSLCITYSETDKQEEVYAFGDNRFGQLGIATTLPSFLPLKVPYPFIHTDTVPIPNRRNFLKVYAGWGHSMVLNTQRKNEIVVFGRNSHGQLGLGSEVSSTVTTPRVLNFGIRKIISLSTGSEHTLALLDGNSSILLSSSTLAYRLSTH